MQFYDRRVIRHAKSDHECHVCGTTLSAGSCYVREVGKYRGEFFSRCSCPSCFAFVSKYLSECGETEYDPDQVYDFVQEEICIHCDHRETCGLHSLQCNTVVHEGEQYFLKSVGVGI